jgi:hypothetical protein
MRRWRTGAFLSSIAVLGALFLAAQKAPEPQVVRGQQISIVNTDGIEVFSVKPNKSGGANLILQIDKNDQSLIIDTHDTGPAVLLSNSTNESKSSVRISAQIISGVVSTFASDGKLSFSAPAPRK